MYIIILIFFCYRTAFCIGNTIYIKKHVAPNSSFLFPHSPSPLSILLFLCISPRFILPALPSRPSPPSHPFLSSSLPLLLPLPFLSLTFPSLPISLSTIHVPLPPSLSPPLLLSFPFPSLLKVRGREGKRGGEREKERERERGGREGKRRGGRE